MKQEYIDSLPEKDYNALVNVLKENPKKFYDRFKMIL